MSPIIDVVLPVYAIVLAGWLAGRLRLLGAEGGAALERFVRRIALPALFLITLLGPAPDGAPFGGFLAAYGGGLLATLGVSLLVAAFTVPARPAVLALQALAASFPNAAYLGVPLLTVALGEAGRLPAILAVALNGVVLVALTVTIAEFDLRHGRGSRPLLRAVAATVLRSPLVLATAAGLGLAGLDVTPPAPLDVMLRLLAATAAGSALFALGLFLVERRFAAGALEIGWLAALKLLLQPLVTWWLAYPLLALDPTWAAAAVLLAALPSSPDVLALARRYGLYEERAAAAIVVTTLLSLASVAALLTLLARA